MSGEWPALPYDAWRETRDTLHAHTQVLGKLSAALTPPEPEAQHLALRLTARGLETRLLRAPDGSGALVVALDLQSHRALVEHSDGRRHQVALAPDRSVGEVTRNVLEAVRSFGGPVEVELAPQETTWTRPLDEDDEHATYDPAQVVAYFAAATRAALVLAAWRAPHRGRRTPVNAWWGSFDLAVSLYSELPADPPAGNIGTLDSTESQEIAVGWWPGDGRYPRAAFYAYARPAPAGFETATLSPSAARWDAELGEFILDWDDVRVADDPHGDALDFARSAARAA